MEKIRGWIGLYCIDIADSEAWNFFCMAIRYARVKERKEKKRKEKKRQEKKERHRCHSAH